MGKKKRSSQNSNNSVCQEESSASESNNDSSQIAEVNKVHCSHFNRSADVNNIRKHFKANKDAYLVCSSCKKSEDDKICKDGWVCLQCGSYNCGPNEADHKTEHYKTPHSNEHSLAYHLNASTIWCFKCEQEIPVDVNKKIQVCVDMIKKQHNDSLLLKPTEHTVETRTMNGSTGQDFLKSDSLSHQSLQNNNQNKVMRPELSLSRVRGLMNLGNTCFFNSVLQCLAQTPGLVPLLEEMDVRGEKFHLELDGITIDTELEKQKSSQVSEQLARILTEIVSGGGNGDSTTDYSPVNPRSLLKALTNKCPQFEGGDQHDSHELLRHLLDSVYKEDLKRYQAAILNHIGFYDEANKNLDELDEEKKKFGKKMNQKVCDTILIRPDHLFKGSLVSILQCQDCRHESKREETFLDLSLPVVHGKAQPPAVLRRKQNSNTEDYRSVEEKCSSEDSVTLSKQQLNKQKRNEKRIRRHRDNRELKKEVNKGEPTIEEEDKKDSINGEQTDADVEDNEDIVCEEQDPKTEIVESGYSSEKQMSARGSPVTTQSTEDQSYDFDKPMITDMSLYSGLPRDSGAHRAESGMGSNQELTVAIPEENNPDCTSQESVQVNNSHGSPDISSDSQQGNFKNVDLSSEYQLVLGRDRILNWNCAELVVDSQESSPGCSRDSQSNDISLPNSNDNMSICDSLPENVSLLLNSPKENAGSESEDKLKVDSEQKENLVKLCSVDDPLELDSANSRKKENIYTEESANIGVENKPQVINRETNSCSPVDQNSGPEELINLRLDNGCRQISRSSPVQLEELTELDSGLLQMSLEGMTCKEDTSPADTSQSVYSDQGQSGFVLVGGVMPTIPLPPPSPPTVMFTTPYKFSHPEPAVPRVDSFYQRHKIEEGECSLQSCLSQFTMIEMLTGGNKVGCEACTERVNKGNKEGKTVYRHSSKQLLICKLPKVMIFHLKRFEVCRFARKISCHVEFPLVLDISPFCSLDENKKRMEPKLYSLYGVVEHSGTMHGGHYVAYVKVQSMAHNTPGVPPPGKWYYISDSRVSNIEESEVLTKQAYLLFYEKML